MSGDTTCYWDPSGQALAQTVKEMRQQAPRGRSVNHTQPDLAQRFKHQWDVWDACSTQPAAIAQPQPPHGSSGSNGGSSGSSEGVTEIGSQVPYVSDALYLRLPLRLQDYKLQGSAIAAAVGTRLGLAGRSVGLSLEGVRAQVGSLCLCRRRESFRSYCQRLFDIVKGFCQLAAGHTSWLSPSTRGTLLSTHAA
jgi:hypothetical protein